MRSKFNIICTVTITSTMSMMLRPSFQVFQIWINTLVLSQSSPCKGTHLFKHIGLYTKFIVVNPLQTLVLATLLLWPCNCIFFIMFRPSLIYCSCWKRQSDRQPLTHSLLIGLAGSWPQADSPPGQACFMGHRAV